MQNNAQKSIHIDILCKETIVTSLISANIVAEFMI